MKAESVSPTTYKPLAVRSYYIYFDLYFTLTRILDNTLESILSHETLSYALYSDYHNNLALDLENYHFRTLYRHSKEGLGTPLHLYLPYYDTELHLTRVSDLSLDLDVALYIAFDLVVDIARDVDRFEEHGKINNIALIGNRASNLEHALDRARKNSLKLDLHELVQALQDLTVPDNLAFSMDWYSLAELLCKIMQEQRQLGQNWALKTEEINQLTAYLDATQPLVGFLNRCPASERENFESRLLIPLE